MRLVLRAYEPEELLIQGRYRAPGRAAQLSVLSGVKVRITFRESDMPDISRRSLAAGVGLLAGAVALPARQQQLAAASAPKVRAQPLTFNPEKVKWLSAQSLAEHHAIYARAA